MLTTQRNPVATGEPMHGVRFLRLGSWSIPVLLIAVHLGLVLCVNLWTVQRFQYSGDEYSCLVSAEIFARGHLSVASPVPSRFFDVVHVVNDGRFYGKYPPGWPLILSLGCRIGVPWIVNPIIGAVSLLVLYLLARRHFSIECANWSLLLCTGNPFLIFNEASLFSHPSCFLFIVLSFFFLFSCLDDPASRWNWIALGLAAGISFIIRPFTAAVMLIPMGGYLAYWSAGPGRLRPVVWGVAMASIPVAIALAGFLAYNHAQTGHAMRMPFQQYDPTDAPTLIQPGDEWQVRVHSHVGERTLMLARWVPLTPLFLLFAPCFHEIRRQPKAMLLIASFVSLFAGYFFYWGDGIVQYGPRYLYESVAALVIVSALVVLQLSRFRIPLAAGLTALNLLALGIGHVQVSREIRGKKDVYDRVADQHLTNAIVFLKTGSGTAPAHDLPRNGIDFNGPVLYVNDLGARNRILLQEFPERKPYSYQFDPVSGIGSITPFELAPTWQSDFDSRK